jgi:ribosomal protein S18 acetylase RimI-like enzyme
MNYDIVPLAPQHIDGFRAALDSVARERKYLTFLEAPPLEKCREFLARTEAYGLPRYVALVEGCVVGWCDISSLERPVFVHSGVLGMGVIAEHRGHGIGEALIRAALGSARAQGLTRVELTVRGHNVRALALYRKIGFEVEGLKKHAVRLDGEYEDLICMAILFQEKP